jgi:hypothetical protein
LRRRPGAVAAAGNDGAGSERRIFLTTSRVGRGSGSDAHFQRKELPVRPLSTLAFVAAFIFTEPGFAQKLVDPDAVAPEYREAALKRRAEQMKVMECNKKADVAKVLPRDRAEHINHCLEASNEK